MIEAVLDFLTAHPTGYRWLAGILGFTASFTQALRLGQFWGRLTPVLHVWGLIILAFSAVCSLGQARAISLHAPPSEFTLVIAAIQVGVIVAALTFPRLFSRPVGVGASAVPLTHSRR